MRKDQERADGDGAMLVSPWLNQKIENVPEELRSLSAQAEHAFGRETAKQLCHWADLIDSALRLLGEGEVVAFRARNELAIGGWNYYDADTFRSPEKEPLYASPVPPAVVVPEGMALVPIEPTDEMVAAGVAVGCEQASHGQHCDDVYCAMLKAHRESQ